MDLKTLRGVVDSTAYDTLRLGLMTWSDDKTTFFKLMQLRDEYLDEQSTTGSCVLEDLLIERLKTTRLCGNTEMEMRNQITPTNRSYTIQNLPNFPSIPPTHTIRPALPADIPTIQLISAHYALNTALTFALTPRPSKHRSSTVSSCNDLNLPFLVATAPRTPHPASHLLHLTPRLHPAIDRQQQSPLPSSGTVIGFALAHPYRPGPDAYATTAELTLFMTPDEGVHERGVGTAL
ncbi:MAG: hypothetical protein MMC23_009006 [Stictis urceolatum]|nr:hypothetical protein [Stictis urceolata]